MKRKAIGKIRLDASRRLGENSVGAHGITPSQNCGEDSANKKGGTDGIGGVTIKKGNLKSGHKPRK